MTVRTHPLDPRAVECSRCKGGGLSYLTADSHGLCEDCRGTGRVALRPEPRVEVWEETHHQRLGKGWWARCEPEKVFPSGIPFHNALGPHPTEADALREARLDFLGEEMGLDLRLVSLLDGRSQVMDEMDAPVTGWYDDHDDAIEAAFAARDRT